MHLTCFIIKDREATESLETLHVDSSLTDLDFVPGHLRSSYPELVENQSVPQFLVCKRILQIL